MTSRSSSRIRCVPARSRSSTVVLHGATSCPQERQTFDNQQVAAYAAGKQSLFWDYAELFYHEQGQEDTSYVDTDYLNGLAQQIPKLDLRWKTDQGDPALLSQVQADEQSALPGLTGTPTLIMSGQRAPRLSRARGCAAPTTATSPRRCRRSSDHRRGAGRRVPSASRRVDPLFGDDPRLRASMGSSSRPI